MNLSRKWTWVPRLMNVHPAPCRIITPQTVSTAYIETYYMKLCNTLVLSVIPKNGGIFPGGINCGHG